MYAVMASHPPTPRTVSCFWLAAASVNEGTAGVCVPSGCTKMPSPPETFRILPSKAPTSSKIADQLSARCWVALPARNVECNGIVRRGPDAKIHTTLSVNPLGWHDPHDPQPLFDILPVMA